MKAGDLVLSRLAVGEHILLGGDNMDLALAYAVATAPPARHGRPRRRPAHRSRACVPQCQGNAVRCDPQELGAR